MTQKTERNQKRKEKRLLRLKEARYDFNGGKFVIRKKQDAVKILIESFFNIDFMLNQLGLQRRSYYRWREKDSEFERACNEIKEGLRDEAEVLLQNRMRKEDTSAIIFYLKTQCKNRGYVEKNEIEHSGQTSTTINLIETPVEVIKNERGQSKDKPEAKGNDPSS